MNRRRALAVVLACAWVALPGPARANGRMPAAHQIAVSPADPSYFVMETTFGLLISHDTGNTFSWVCEAPIGYGDAGTQDPAIGLTTTTLFAGIQEGLSLSSDRGCTWSLPIRDPVIDVVVRRDDPHTALVLTSQSAGVSEAGTTTYTTQVLITHDDGAHWAQQGVPIDPDMEVETLEVATSDPMRLYVGGAKWQPDGDGGVERIAVVLTSRNGGMTYVPGTIPLVPPYEPSRGAAFVSAVDPANANRVYVRLGDLVVDRLLVSDDGAATFQTVYQGNGTLPGFALSSDGLQVYVGGPRDGVQWASAPPGEAGAGLQFSQRATAGVSCLAAIGGALYACMGQPQNSFLQQLGRSTDQGATFSPVFLFSCLSGPLACPGGGVAAQCGTAFMGIHASIGVCPDAGADAGGGADASPDAAPADGGAPPQDGSGGGNDSAGGSMSDAPASDDGGSDAGAPPAPAPRCGCQAGDAAGAGGVSLLAVVTASLLRRRRRTAG
jgi:MYXO-CTERM domain-containing protein